MNGMTARGLAISKYGSMGKFAKHIGWSARRTRDILSGRQEPTANDIADMAKAFGITDPDEFVNFFYPSLPQRGAPPPDRP